MFVSIALTSSSTGLSISPVPDIGETTLVSITSFILFGIVLSSSKFITSIVTESDLLLPSTDFAVIVTEPAALAITLALFPTTSIEAILLSLVDHSISFISALSSTDAVNTFSPPTNSLSNLLFIVTLSTRASSFFTVIVIVLVALAPWLSSTLYFTV